MPKKKSQTEPYKQLERISSGASGFDKIIEGGFEQGSINLLVGGSGSAKTIFATQFLAEGLRKGESCLFITFEEKKENFFNEMRTFNWKLEEYEKQEKLVFLEYNPEKVRTMLDEGGGAIESIVIKNKIKRIVLDSVTSFALLFEGELEKREQALALFNIIRKWGCTCVLTLEEDPTDRDKGPSIGLEFEADSITLLYFVRYRDKRTRFVEVLKMRGTKHSTELYPFEITKEGVVLGQSVRREAIDIS